MFNVGAGTARRNVHSNRQRKRLFDRNPARLRVVGPKAPPEVPPRKFSPILEPTFLSNGWVAPSYVDRPDYPFVIQRTGTGFLPVYAKHRKDGTKTTTKIRRVTGNIDSFHEELASVLAEETSSLPTIRRRQGSIEVDGNHVRTVKFWLAGLGF